MAIQDEVLLLTDRFYNASDPDAVDRQSQLQQCLILVIVIHATVLIACWKGWDFEKAHPRQVRHVEVAFEFNIAPPEPIPLIKDLPKPIHLTNSEEGLSLPVIRTKVDKPIAPAKQLPSKPVPSKEPIKISHKTPIPEPITLIPTHGLRPPRSPVSTDIIPGPESTEPGGATPGNGQDGNGNGGGTGTGADIPITKTITAKDKGNIAPYRKELLKRIAQNWHPPDVNRRVLIDLKVGPSGELLSSEIVESSESKRFDRQVKDVIGSTGYEPLPDWYRGKYLVFRIELTRAVAWLGIKGG